MTSSDSPEPQLPKQFRRPRHDHATAAPVANEAGPQTAPGPSRAGGIPSVPPPPGYVPRRQSLAQRKKGFHWTRGIVIALVAFGVVVAGSTMPWFHLTIGSRTVEFHAANAIYVKVLGVVSFLAALFYVKVPNIAAFWIIMFSMVVTTIIAVAAWFNFTGGISTFSGTHDLLVVINTTSAGFLLVFVGAIVGLFATNAGRRAARGY